MISDYMNLVLASLPFILFAWLNGRVNVKKRVRCNQYGFPVFALIYSVSLMIFRGKVLNIQLDLAKALAGEAYDPGSELYYGLIIFNTAVMAVYVVIKGLCSLIIGRVHISANSAAAPLIGIFYTYSDSDSCWYIREHYGQACSFIKTAYYACCAISAAGLLVSCALCAEGIITAPFYPVFAIIILGEIAFFLDGKEGEEKKSKLRVEADKSRHVAMYPLLRKPLRTLFGDKLSAEGTTVNEGGVKAGSVEDILISLEKEGGHIGKNYSTFIRRKMTAGLKPNPDYLRSGYELASGRSLLFNTPFYDKLDPYVFYAMNRELLTGGKVLIVLGRHGTEQDLYDWCEKGMFGISNIKSLWKIGILSGKKLREDEYPDIGIISRSGVHDLDIHRNNLGFLGKVSFVFVVEPSRLVATAQIGLNLLIKCCGADKAITFCSVDRNCDGLVDAMSHILMTNITEVSATEYPHGTSSFMCWIADSDYLQHRIVPGVSRYLGIGTELSMAALKNQVKKTVWYGGEVFPVLDAHWIAKQYYFDLLDYAELPTNQETFDTSFLTSFNMCNEKVSDYSFVTVEDDRYNLFETRRNFATIAERQGFVNVISPEYMLREYMSSNPKLFTADPKAIPYITADYARTKRNTIISLCLLLCIDSVREETLDRQMVMMNIDTRDPVGEVWKELCIIFSDESEYAPDKNGNPVLSVKDNNGKTVVFRKDETIIFKRAYSVERGKFESVYAIEDKTFADIILNNLRNASYIAEQESRDVFIGSELKGHVYQKYLPGQLFTLNGKYYEMIGAAVDNRIMVRRASDHIAGRLFYRQIRNYTINSLEDSDIMGALKSINNVDVHYQFADFSVETPGYWKLGAYNDFENGKKVKVNGVPVREYHHKQILTLDFSKLGEAFTDSIRLTLTNLLNEAFVTLFADNQPFISAITEGSYDAPVTYGLELGENVESSGKCIYIIEDSQLDIGLLVAVERNIDRIFHIISDYLSWNEEMIEESIRRENEPPEEKTPAPFDAFTEDEEAAAKKKKGFFARIIERIKKVFTKKKKEKPEEKPEEKPAEAPAVPEENAETPAEAEEENPSGSEASAEEAAGLEYEEIPKKENETEVKEDE